MSIEAMKLALEALENSINVPRYGGHPKQEAAAIALRQAIAEAEQAHPVAWMHEMLRVQGCDGTWNYDPYMHGMYNGMEYMLAMVENREPVFRDAPDKWLNTLPPASIASEAHGIKETT